MKHFSETVDLCFNPVLGLKLDLYDFKKTFTPSNNSLFFDCFFF